MLAVLLATIIQGVTSFALTQLLSKAAQRLIAELRRKVQAHIGRLRLPFYDANKTGALVSRIMTDVEGIRNLDRHRAGRLRRRPTDCGHCAGVPVPHQRC